MMRRIPASYPPELLDSARENQSGELAWQYPTILEVVAALAAQGFAILGGDVMYVEDGRLDYFHDGIYCGNWYLDWRPGEQSWQAYVAESVSVTVRYIEEYVRRNSEAYWYVPVAADEQTCATLDRR